jgi:hypothetical protein
VVIKGFPQVITGQKSEGEGEGNRVRRKEGEREIELFTAWATRGILKRKRD